MGLNVWLEEEEVAKEFYVQCRLRKHQDNGFPSYKVAWIPEKFAEEKRILKIKIDGKWDKGWVVVNAWGGRVSREEINERSRYYKSQRSHSDI